MTVDVLSALVRALSFIALFQAGGVAIAIALFGRRLEHSAQRIRSVGLASAVAGLILVPVHYALEAARMAGSLAGVFDLYLQQIVFDSPLSSAAGLRIGGLVLVAIAMRWRNAGAAPLGILVGILGTLCITLAFAFVGHTADESRTSWLAVLLVLHLLVVAFWFGGLAPLHIVAGREPAQVAAQIVATFTRIATVVVPGLFLFGVSMAILLIDRWGVLGESYGILLLMKVAGFAILMGLAALNKWRHGPAIARGGAGVAAFQRTVAIEYVLICGVLAVTAVMTTFFSPSH